jgi:hypothetical protein
MGRYGGQKTSMNIGVNVKFSGCEYPGARSIDGLENFPRVRGTKRGVDGSVIRTEGRNDG